jgi:hypothetical protein
LILLPDNYKEFPVKMAPKPDFSGYATRSGVKCTDGHTILAHAFKEMDGKVVPLVYQHQHQSPQNVLGHVIMHAVPDGVRVDGFFNDTESGIAAKKQVKHGDLKHLSIYANNIVKKGFDVVHGVIREVSLVLAGANPGAYIDCINLAHGDGVNPFDDEAIVYTDAEIELPAPDVAEPEPALAHASTKVSPPAKVPMGNSSDAPPPGSDAANAGDTVDDHDADDLPPDASPEEVIKSFTPQQLKVFYATVGAAMADSVAQSADLDTNSTTNNEPKGDAPVTRNVFDQTVGTDQTSPGYTLTHADAKAIFADAQKGGSLKGAVDAFCLSHGIDNIATLFPYDQAVTDTPDFISRRMEWVAGVLSATRKTPFSRIRSWTADITFQEARAKGYVKATLKKEEFVRIARRITTPQTVYKKQKLDRDDILDITEFDVVNWLQTEMRIMLDEELARAILIGDGRDVDDPDKINTANVRPIYGDDEMYVTQVSVAKTDIDSSADAIVDGVVNAFRFYRGSGNPVFYTTRIWLAKMLLIKDTLGRRLYPTVQELSAALGVDGVVACEALEAQPELIGIVVNLTDYTCGTDKGGEVSMFDFFDIDYNTFKYLMETRMSGAMTKYRGALTIVQFTGAGGILPDPAPVTFDSITGVGTVPDASGLHYTYVTVADDGTQSGALTAGAQSPISSGAYVTYRAVPSSTYQFSVDNFQWTFRRD